jgi:prepilin-type N-terminal cleavage/methylation domain-containing protein
MRAANALCEAGQASAPPSQRGFTLAEVLAALVFMAIVIPVAVQGLKIANQAGQVAVRKGEAIRVADRILNESIVTTNWSRSGQSGSLTEGIHQFRWQLRNQVWNQEPLHLVSVQVKFAVQGRDYDVQLSTLVDNSQ